MKPKKLDCLEGIRALCCLSVVLSHYCGAFFPNSAIAQRFMSTPLFFLYSGNTAVRLMFALSGFVLSYKYFRSGHTDTLEQDAVKRYFRLAIPSAAVVLFAYFLMKLNLMYQVPAAELTGSLDFLAVFNQFEPSFLGAVKEGFFGVPIKGFCIYVGPLWTMSCELFGSYFIFAVVAILKNKRARYFFYVIYLLAFPAYYNYFILGMAVADLYAHEDKLNSFFQKNRTVCVIVHIACWMYIGAVPNIDAYYKRGLFFCAAAAVMFLTALNSTVLQRVWGTKTGVWFGKQSFSVYLLHWPLIESAACYLFLQMMGKGISYDISRVAVILISLPLITAISAVFTRFVVEPSAKISNRAAEFILRERNEKSKI